MLNFTPARERRKGQGVCSWHVVLKVSPMQQKTCTQAHMQGWANSLYSLFEGHTPRHKHTLSVALTLSHTLTNIKAPVMYFTGEAHDGKLENLLAGRVICTVSVGVWKLQRWRELWVCICLYVYVRVCSHICVCSVVEKREMVKFIYMRHSACSPSEKIGCECCQLYALSAVSVTLRVSNSG